MSYTFYWGDNPLNFGDILTKNILDHFGIEHTHTNNPMQADMFATGSIARLAPFGATVIGSGVIRLKEDANPTVNWRSVRGPLTRANVIRCGGECPEIYGDPALLLPLFCPESEKKHKIGIVPHYQDWNAVKTLYPHHHIIDVVNEDPMAVAKQITECEKIISSSLHGIIAAQAYGIPAARVSFSKLHGDGIKFDDFYASIDRKCKISTVESPDYVMGDLPDLNPLIDIFKSLGEDND